MKYIKMIFSDDDLHSAFKGKCARDKVSMKDKLIELVIYYTDYTPAKTNQIEIFGKKGKDKKK